MYNPIEERRRFVQAQIQKSFDSGINVAEEIDIEKAYNVGDEKQYQGVTYYVHAFNAKGQPLWRKKKDDKGNKPSVVDTINKIPEKEFKRITQMLEKKNPDHRDAERYLEEEAMSDKELKNFHAVAEHFKNSSEINKLTQEYCRKWAELARQELQSRNQTSTAKNQTSTQAPRKQVEAKKYTKSDTSIDQDVYDKTYKIAISKEETEKHLKESLDKIERNIKEVKDAISTSTSQIIIDKMKKMLTSSVSKKKAIEDALKNRNNKKSDPRDKVAQEAGFKDYKEMKGYQDYVTQKNLLKKKSTKDGMRLLYEKEVTKYEKNHADLIKRIGSKNKK